MNYRLIATEVGDLVKWDTSVNEIRRTANALFRFSIESFPNDAITSSRAQTVYDAIMSLAKQKMTDEERNRLLVTFCRRITPDAQRSKLDQLLEDTLGPSNDAVKQTHQEFVARGLHP